MAADVAMKTKATMTAVTASRGVRVSSATAADNMKTGANTAAKAVPAPARAPIRADVPHPVMAGASPEWTATRSGVSPAKAAGHLTNTEAGTGMTKADVAARAADHPVTAALPLLPVAAVHRTALPAAAGQVHLPATAIQVLRGVAIRDNNVMPADSSPAGAAVRVTAAGPIPVTVIAIAAATAAAIAAIANHS